MERISCETESRPEGRGLTGSKHRRRSTGRPACSSSRLPVHAAPRWRCRPPSRRWQHGRRERFSFSYFGTFSIGRKQVTTGGIAGPGAETSPAPRRGHGRFLRAARRAPGNEGKRRNLGALDRGLPRGLLRQQRGEQQRTIRTTCASRRARRRAVVAVGRRTRIRRNATRHSLGADVRQREKSDVCHKKDGQQKAGAARGHDGSLAGFAGGATGECIPAPPHPSPACSSDGRGGEIGAVPRCNSGDSSN